MKATANANPFPGLRPFHESEQHLFFGRESQIDAMVDKLAANRFLAVVGTSGSGKSSLVNCGLRPALRAGLMAAAGSHWRMAQCRPGGDPMAELSRCLAEDGVLFTNFQEQGMPLHDIVDTTLRMSTLGLVDIVEQAQLPEACNLLLVIDQFEELFRYRHLGANSEDKGADVGQQAVAFVNLLLSAIEQQALPIYVVITMRSDFLGDCAQFPGLAEAINKGQYLVPRMTREQRRAAIAGPVRVGGGKIYPALLSRLVNDVGENPDQLSILQHALNRTWAFWENERQCEGMLDNECYESIGSMASALDLHAESAFMELDTQRQRKLCELLFKALTDKASDPRGVRRPTRFDTLCKLCDASPQELLSVIEIFRKPSRSFLMPPSGIEIQPDTVMDISHESLMRVWLRLDRWASEESDAASMYQRLSQTAVLNTNDEAGLLRNPDLRVARQWRDKNKPNSSWANRYNSNFDLAMSFLARSEKSHRRRVLLQKGAMAAGLLVVMGGVAFASYYYNARKVRVVEQQRQKVFNEKLDAENDLAQANEAIVSVAHEKARETQAKEAALQALQETRQAIEEVKNDLTQIEPHESSQSTARSPDSNSFGRSRESQSNTVAGNNVSSILQSSVLRLANLDHDLAEESTVIAETSTSSAARNDEDTMDAANVSRGTIASADEMETSSDEMVTSSDQIVTSPDIAAANQATTDEPGSTSNFVPVFQVCTLVEKLVPTGCVDEGQGIPEGRVYLFARVITQLKNETVDLRGYAGNSERPSFTDEFTIRPNPDGYRLYTWKQLKSGQYRACISAKSTGETQCIDITVSDDD